MRPFSRNSYRFVAARCEIASVGSWVFLPRQARSAFALAIPRTSA